MSLRDAPELSLCPPDEAPDFSAADDADLISNYLAKTDNHDISDHACQIVYDTDMLKAFLSMTQAQFDALAAISLPVAIYGQTWRDQKLAQLRIDDVSDQDSEFARMSLLSPHDLYEELHGA